MQYEYKPEKFPECCCKLNKKKRKREKKRRGTGNKNAISQYQTEESRGAG